jgi:predicted metalloprotease with PDZ domain
MMKPSIENAFAKCHALCAEHLYSASRFVLCLAFLGFTASPSDAVTSYAISLANAEQHVVQVQMILPEGSPERELQLPVWNALYQIRDFSQYVNWIRAKDRAGRALTIRSINDSRWQVTGAQLGAIIEYEIYADSPGPFGAQLNSHHAFFNLAQILIYPVDARNESMLVRFDQMPQSWHIATPLAADSDGRFSAETYDHLVDSPVEIGSFQESDFNESGARYRVIIDAEAGDYDAETVTSMLHKIVAAATAWMNDRPFTSYMFIYHFPHGPAGGGMEHSYSTAISLNSDALARDPEILASVSAHEFFHLWNVKRIRPQTLEPVDYTKENFTRALWFSEGCTSTAADFILLRAGLLDERHFEQELAADIGELQRRPAHLRQSAEQSSLDAWLEGSPYYRRPERSISYYNKGELLGILLDLDVREASRGKASLREVFQWMNLNYAKKGRFFPDSDAVRQAAEAVSHADLESFFQNYVAGTVEIPWDDFFRVVGLHLMETTNTVTDAGFTASRSFDAPMIVAAIVPGGPAELAGLQVGETILEINGAAPGQDAAESVSALSPGDTLTVKVLGGREGQHELKWKIGSREEVSYELKDLDNITSAQRAARAAWLKGEAQKPAAP